MTEQQAENIENILNKALSGYSQPPLIRAIPSGERRGGDILVNIGDLKFGYRAVDESSCDTIIDHIKGIIGDNKGSFYFKKQ